MTSRARTFKRLLELSLMMEREANLQMQVAIQGRQLLVFRQEKIQEREEQATRNAYVAMEAHDREASALAWGERDLSVLHISSVEKVLKSARQEEDETRTRYLERRQNRSHLESMFDRMEAEESVLNTRREQREAEDLYLLRRNSG